MSTVPLRTAILDAALPLVARHSFTRAAVQDGARLAIRARKRGGEVGLNEGRLGVGPADGELSHELDARRSSSDSAASARALGEGDETSTVLSTLFGPGTGPESALVAHWAERGLEAMQQGGQSGKSPSETLGRRLAWSEETAGEHLVEAHALLSAPSDPLAIPLPRSLRYILSTLRPPAPYRPPHLVSGGRSDPSAAEESEGTVSIRETLTLPLINPLPVLGYAMRIADQAVHLADVGEGVQQTPAPGGGTDWYLRRLALGLIYLKAESRLLLPRTATSPPPLPYAQQTLHTSLSHYCSLASSLRAALPPISNTGTDDSLAHVAPRGPDGRREGDAWREVGEFGAFVWKSWGGLFRSRGWIN